MSLIEIWQEFNILSIINQQDATLAVLCLLKTTSVLYMFQTPFVFETCGAYLYFLINAILPELHLVGLLYIIDLWCTETQI